MTNYSINKKSKKFQSNQDAGSAEGHKWSMKILWGELQKQGYDTAKIWEDIKGKNSFGPLPKENGPFWAAMSR